MPYIMGTIVAKNTISLAEEIFSAFQLGCCCLKNDKPFWRLLVRNTEVKITNEYTLISRLDVLVH